MFFTLLLLLASADHLTRCVASPPAPPQRGNKQGRFGYRYKDGDNPEAYQQNTNKYNARDSRYNEEHDAASIIYNYIDISSRLDDDIMEHVKTELLRRVCHNITSRHRRSDSLTEYACSFLSTNVYPDAFKTRKLFDSLLNQRLPTSRTSGHVNYNGTTSARFARAADSGSTEHQQSGFFPHIYPYNDETELKKLQKYDDSVYYIPHDQYHDNSGYNEEPPAKYVQVYPGAFQPQYSYSKIPRSYWMFAVFKGLFTIWEILQTLAILYLLWKVAFLTFVPGREETNILTQVWDDVSAILRLKVVESSDSGNQRQVALDTPDLSGQDVTQDNTTDRIAEAAGAQGDTMSKRSEEQNSTESTHSRMERAADEENYFEVLRPRESNRSKSDEAVKVEQLWNNSADLSEFITVMRQEWLQHTNVDCTSCENLRTFNRKPDVPWTNNRIITTLVSHLLGSSVPLTAQHQLQ